MCVVEMYEKLKRVDPERVELQHNVNDFIRNNRTPAEDYLNHYQYVDKESEEYKNYEKNAAKYYGVSVSEIRKIVTKVSESK